ncbi:MAG: hypothetical protein JWM54_2326 [Acidobacteriaceae bacterium]|nr:hypothetical protein [Acidobacteriaceae bacterium]
MAQLTTAPDLPADLDETARSALIQRISNSRHFKGSARLRDFLFYIADCAIRNAPQDATEQQIGFRVFGRSPGYNSSEDSIVRSHARLLRQKLASYFAEEGSDEPVVVDVPKGHYLPVFRSKPGDQAVALTQPSPIVPLATALPVLETPSTPRPSRWKWIAACLLAVVVLQTLLLSGKWMKRAATGQGNAAVDRLWKTFLTDDPPLVVFSNALFVGDSKRGLSYAPATGETLNHESPNLVDTYTGIGELAAVYTLTRLFDAHQAHFILKRSRLMTWDEAKAKNLIFIGSTAENPSLSALQSTQDFTIMATPESAGIVNHHPHPGEPTIYTRPEHPLTRDYAILALLPGMQAGERILVFSGLTTFGTQAAVDFVCRQETAADLVRQISGPKGEIRPFEAVIETTVTGGVPVQAHLVTIHVH